MGRRRALSRECQGVEAQVCNLEERIGRSDEGLTWDGSNGSHGSAEVRWGGMDGMDGMEWCC